MRSVKYLGKYAIKGYKQTKEHVEKSQKGVASYYQLHSKRLTGKCICGKEFVFFPSEKKKYCSLKCFGSSLKNKPSSVLGTKRPGQINETSFKKGQVPWNKGKNFMKGEFNPNWKGGISTENHLIRTSKEYAYWRLQVLKRDNYTCQECLKRGGVLEVDHIKPFSLYPELRLEIDNGRVLCKTCHFSITNILKKGNKYGFLIG